MKAALREMAEEWLSGYVSDHTRRAYERDILDFFEWCADQSINELEIRRVDCNRFKTELVNRGHSDTTIKRKLAGARSFYEYWLQEDRIAKNPFRFVAHKFDQTGSMRTRGLSAEEAYALMEVARRNDRDFILCGLMLYCGRRVGEVVNARAEDLGETEGHRILLLKGKGNKLNRILLTPALAAAIDRYLADRTEGPLICPLRASGFKHPFPHLRGEMGRLDPPIRHLGRPGAWRRIETLVREAGLGASISPHSLRRSAATVALGNGTPLHVVQDFLNHANPATTQLYNRDRNNLEDNPAPLIEEVVARAGLSEGDLETEKEMC